MMVEAQLETNQVEGPVAREDLLENETTKTPLTSAVGRGDAAGTFDPRAVLNTGWTNRLTGPTVEASVHVLGKVRIVLLDLAFVDGLDLVDPAARRVHFRAEHTVSRAVIQTQPAVDALLEQCAIELHIHRGHECRRGLVFRYRHLVIRPFSAAYNLGSLNSVLGPALG